MFDLSAKPKRISLSAGQLAVGKVDAQGRRIAGYSVITRGEALGHYLWIDKAFLKQVAQVGNATEGGIRTRFNHPSFFGDGALGTALGRSQNFRVKGDQVLADLELLEAASDSPKGDLAGYVMKLAAEAPDLLAASIEFSFDWGEMDRFIAAHEDKDGRFISPDKDNVNNRIHARLNELLASDLVDEPAANPAGLFGAGDPGETERFLAYVLGLSDEAPTVALGRPDRTREIVAAFLEKRGLAIQAPAQIANATITWVSDVAQLEMSGSADSEMLTAIERRLLSLEKQFEVMGQRLALRNQS